ncbi:hypothetical protein HK405_002928, partial [Cladochytrium tenue]
MPANLEAPLLFEDPADDDDLTGDNGGSATKRLQGEKARAMAALIERVPLEVWLRILDDFSPRSLQEIARSSRFLSFIGISAAVVLLHRVVALIRPRQPPGSSSSSVAVDLVDHLDFSPFLIPSIAVGAALCTAFPIGRDEIGAFVSVLEAIGADEGQNSTTAVKQAVSRALQSCRTRLAALPRLSYHPSFSVTDALPLSFREFFGLTAARNPSKGEGAGVVSPPQFSFATTVAPETVFSTSPSFHASLSASQAMSGPSLSSGGRSLSGQKRPKSPALSPKVVRRPHGGQPASIGRSPRGSPADLSVLGMSRSPSDSNRPELLGSSGSARASSGWMAHFAWRSAYLEAAASSVEPSKKVMENLLKITAKLDGEHVEIAVNLLTDEVETAANIHQEVVSVPALSLQAKSAHDVHPSHSATSTDPELAKQNAGAEKNDVFVRARHSIKATVLFEQEVAKFQSGTWKHDLQAKLLKVLAPLLSSHSKSDGSKSTKSLLSLFLKPESAAGESLEKKDEEGVATSLSSNELSSFNPQSLIDRAWYWTIILLKTADTTSITKDATKALRALAPVAGEARCIQLWEMAEIWIGSGNTNLAKAGKCIAQAIVTALPRHFVQNAYEEKLTLLKAASTGNDVAREVAAAEAIELIAPSLPHLEAASLLSYVVDRLENDTHQRPSPMTSFVKKISSEITTKLDYSIEQIFATHTFSPKYAAKVKNRATKKAGEEPPVTAEAGSKDLDNDVEHPKTSQAEENSRGEDNATVSVPSAESTIAPNVEDIGESVTVTVESQSTTNQVVEEEPQLQQSGLAEASSRVEEPVVRNDELNAEGGTEENTSATVNTQDQDVKDDEGKVDEGKVDVAAEEVADPTLNHLALREVYVRIILAASKRIAECAKPKLSVPTLVVERPVSPLEDDSTSSDTSDSIMAVNDDEPVDISTIVGPDSVASAMKALASLPPDILPREQLAGAWVDISRKDPGDQDGSSRWVRRALGSVMDGKLFAASVDFTLHQNQTNADDLDPEKSSDATSNPVKDPPPPLSPLTDLARSAPRDVWLTELGLQMMDQVITAALSAPMSQATQASELLCELLVFAPVEQAGRIFDASAKKAVELPRDSDALKPVHAILAA